MLIITDFAKIYPGNTDPVLSIARWEAAKGIYWIKGENGCGKTSLFSAVAGLLPYAGNISVNNLCLKTNRKAYTKMVNHAAAEPEYPPFLTGKELLDFYTATKGNGLPRLLSAQLGVDKYMHQKTGTYSSGMLKKLSLVLAFTGNPVLILLDEPLVALDVAAVDILEAAIRQYYQAGVSFFDHLASAFEHWHSYQQFFSAR